MRSSCLAQYSLPHNYTPATCLHHTSTAASKLQQHFNKHTFQEEESVYRDEKITFSHTAFIDNQPVVDLIEKKPYGALAYMYYNLKVDLIAAALALVSLTPRSCSRRSCYHCYTRLMPLLDEEVKLPRGSDAAWLSKCRQHNADHPALVGAAGAFTVTFTVPFTSITLCGGNPSKFIVKHYAGPVGYDSTNFVDTNKDNLFRDLYDVMSNSGSAITQALCVAALLCAVQVHSVTGVMILVMSSVLAVFPPKDSNPRRATTLGEKFRRALLDLMVLVDRCEPWMCMEQLTYAGVFEAVAIRKTGYPFRLTHCRFANRYRCLAYKPGGWVPLKVRSSDHRAMCSALLQCVNQDFSAVQIGVTMVLYRCVLVCVGRAATTAFSVWALKV
eukprot:14491-Heterococcus_DN1.PRE.1